MSLTLIFVIVTVGASLYAWNNQHILGKWMFNPYTIRRNREYYRFITSGLIHNGFLHLFFNMFVLFFFGLRVEFLFREVYGELWGVIAYGLLYILGIVISDIPTYLKYKHAPHYSALGASGGVSSVLFSAILFNPAEDICLYGILCMSGVLWGALYIIYSFYMGKRGGDHINHDAHLYGGIFGILFTILVYPEVVWRFISQLPYVTIF